MALETQWGAHSRHCAPSGERKRRTEGPVTASGCSQPGHPDRQRVSFQAASPHDTTVVSPARAGRDLWCWPGSEQLIQRKSAFSAADMPLGGTRVRALITH